MTSAAVLYIDEIMLIAAFKVGRLSGSLRSSMRMCSRGSPSMHAPYIDTYLHERSCRSAALLVRSLPKTVKLSFFRPSSQPRLGIALPRPAIDSPAAYRPFGPRGTAVAASQVPRPAPQSPKQRRPGES